MNKYENGKFRKMAELQKWTSSGKQYKTKNMVVIIITYIKWSTIPIIVTTENRI